MTYIIAIANEKGGVAKTTTTLSLGGALVENGHDVLLVDLDPQGNLTLACGIKPSQVRRSMADVLLNTSTTLSVSRETPLPGLDLIPANAEMGRAEHFLPIRTNFATLLREAFDEKLYFDYILLDCPPSLGAITTSALTAADLLIIPTQAEYFSSHALRNIMGLVRQVRSGDNPQLTFRVLLTMLDLRNRIHRIIREQLVNSLGDGLFETVIQIDTKLRESVVVGLPVTHFAKKTRSALQYRNLALEITQNVRQTVAQPA
jgi:chromosome partitioning protein